MATNPQPTPLFGGAMATRLPADYLDAAELRDVPDTQEVFLERTGSRSIIISLLEAVDAPDAPEALRIHFEDSVAGETDRDGNADAAKVWALELLPGPAGVRAAGGQEAVEACMLVATMTTSEAEKANARARGREEVVFTGVVMALVRLPQVKTDVVLSINVPHNKQAFEQFVDGVSLESWAEEAAAVVRDGLVAGLEVRDWSLFGES